MDTGTVVMIDGREDDMIIVPIPSENSFTTTLYILNAMKSYTGYYWIRLPFDDVCNVSLTVATSM